MDYSGAHLEPRALKYITIIGAKNGKLNKLIEDMIKSNDLLILNPIYESVLCAPIKIRKTNNTKQNREGVRERRQGKLRHQKLPPAMQHKRNKLIKKKKCNNIPA